LVKIFDLHFVTRFGQRIDGAARHGVASTVRKRVGYDNETLHGVNDRRAKVLMLAYVRTKRATTAERQGQVGNNVPLTARPGLIAFRWCSAQARG
jgi:hypothetical protein